jgi:hypothetical protein
MPFNLSGPFLAQFGIDLLHSEGALLNLSGFINDRKNIVQL